MRFGLDNQKIEKIITVFSKSKTVKKVVIFGFQTVPCAVILKMTELKFINEMNEVIYLNESKEVQS